MTAREIAQSALFVAMGLTVPMLFHAAGLGSAFLPMFLPVLAAGLMLRPALGGMVGFLTPLASALLTGMPPLAPPIAPVMAVEGLALGGLSGWLYRGRGWNICLASAVAVAVERLLMALLRAAMAPLFGLPGPLAAFGSLVNGLPGTALLIGLVPALARRVEKAMGAARGV